MTSFFDLWQSLSESAPVRPIFQIPVSGKDSLLYQVQTFLRRSERVARAFTEELDFKQGARIALLIDAPNEFAQLLHGFWLVGLVPVILSLDKDAEGLATLLKAAQVEGVVFSPEATGKIASVSHTLTGVRHWIVTGSSRSGYGGLFKRLDDLLLGVRGKGAPKLPEVTPDSDALLLGKVRSSGVCKLLRYSLANLFASGRRLAEIVPSSEQSLTWSLLHWKSLPGLMHTFVLPLFHPVPSLVNDEASVREFWNQVNADDVTSVILSLEDLRYLARRGRTRLWKRPEKLSDILVYSSGVLSGALWERFISEFGILPRSTYSLTEAGGVVSALPYGMDPSEVEQWYMDFDVVSAGIPLPGMEIKVSDLLGNDLGPQMLGEIRVRAEFGCGEDLVQKGEKQSRALDEGQEGTVDQHGFYCTGDEGFIIQDEEQVPHLFITGRRTEMIERGMDRISPARIHGEILNLRGVEDCAVIGFDNVAQGKEIGAYVQLSAAARYTARDIQEKLTSVLEWHELPKVILIAERGSNTSIPTGASLLREFDDYYDSDFSVVDSELYDLMGE